MTEHNSSVNSICYSPDNKFIVTGDYSGKIKIWCTKTYHCIITLDGDGNIRSACVSPDNKNIVSGHTDGNVKIWDMMTGVLVKILSGHANWIRSVCYSSDNKFIMSGSDDKTIKIWNAKTGDLINTLSGYPHYVMGACYSSDNKLIIYGSYDRIIKIWDAETSNLINTLNGENNIYTICYMPAIKLTKEVVLPSKELAKVSAWIDSENVLTYDVPAKFNVPSIVSTGKLSLITPLVIDINEGTKIKIGTNTYIVVSEYMSEMNKIQELIGLAKETCRSKIIPVGSSVQQQNGISVAIAEEIKVKLPDNCIIKLNAGTKLQQVDSLVKLSLVEECKAVIC